MIPACPNAVLIELAFPTTSYHAARFMPINWSVTVPIDVPSATETRLDTVIAADDPEPDLYHAEPAVSAV